MPIRVWQRYRRPRHPSVSMASVHIRDPGRSPPDRQIVKPHPPHQRRVVQVAPVHDQRLFELGLDEVEVGAAEFLPFGHDDQGVGDDVMMLADGNGDFTKAIGLEMDGSKFGMGLRSQRYSMIVRDGVVDTLNVEAGGEFKVSSADYMLAQL